MAAKHALGHRRLARLVVALMMAATLLTGSFAVSLAAPVSPPWREPLPQRAHAVIKVGDQTLDVALALTEPERELGLGYRDGLAPGTGMLFLFPDAALRTFWMKGMRFCLDIVWIEQGQIVGAAEKVCPSPAGTPDTLLPRFQSPRPVHDVLEVPAGWLAAHGLGAGSPVTMLGIPANAAS